MGIAGALHCSPRHVGGALLLACPSFLGHDVAHRNLTGLLRVAVPSRPSAPLKRGGYAGRALLMLRMSQLDNHAARQA